MYIFLMIKYNCMLIFCSYVYLKTNAVFEIPWNESVSNSMVSAWTNFGLYAIPNVTNDINSCQLVRQMSWIIFLLASFLNFLVWNFDLKSLVYIH